MNQRLVDSLVQVIEALSPEERKLLESRLQLKAVQKTPGVCGGHACIRNTRIPVWVLVSLRQQGANDRELLQNYPNLTPEDLIAAWEYYEQHNSYYSRLIQNLSQTLFSSCSSLLRGSFFLSSFASLRENKKYQPILLNFEF